MALSVGDVFAEFTVHGVLGDGGMGWVYLVKHPRLPRFDALKVLHPHLSDKPGFAERFQREADLASRLDHPNLVRVYDRGAADGQLWILMQYVAGSDAERALRESGARMPPARAVRIITEVAAGLDHAHINGLVHRDVKPANILLSAKNGASGAEQVLLTDFGIAKALDETVNLTETGSVLASFDYAAPERLERPRTADHRADIYSLGCTLFELLTGSVPYPGQSQAAAIVGHSTRPPPRPTDLVPELARGFDHVIATAMAKDPDERFHSCQELATAAQEALEGTATAHPRAATPTSMRASETVIRRPADHRGIGRSAAKAGTGRAPTTAQPRRIRSLVIGCVLLLVGGGLLAVVMPWADDGGGTSPQSSTSSETGSTASEVETTATGSSGTAPDVLVGSCLDARNEQAPCDAAHALEVFALAPCAAAELLVYLGGTTTDVLRSSVQPVDVTVQEMQVCALATPSGVSGGSAEGILLLPAGDAWRRCLDARVNAEVACAEPHTAEVVFDSASAPDEELVCTTRAQEYLGAPLSRFQFDLSVVTDETQGGPQCVVQVLGNNVLTSSVRRIGTNAVPISAAP